MANGPARSPRDRDVSSQSNELGGSVSGSVFQARDVHGAVHIHSGPEAPAGSTVPRPRELVPAPLWFTDRTDALARLDEVIDEWEVDGPPVVTVVSGTGGVGKTALLLHWLHHKHERFPDGQLYVDLRGFSSQDPVAPAVVLPRFLRSLGVTPERVPVDLDEQSVLFRSMTAGRRLAILADNAASAAQVRALLPGPGRNLVAVTSRRAVRGLVGEGAWFIELGPLGQDGAVELLSKLIGAERVDREPEAVRTLAGLCGRLPIALCASAARLAERKRWRLDRAVGELADERRRFAALSMDEEITVRAVFDLSYAALADDAATLYRRLGLHPGPDFSLAAASAISDLDEDRCEQLLIDLVNSSLLEEVGEDRYRQHDLVRLHAVEKAREMDGEARLGTVAARIVDWYLVSAAAADLVVIPGRWRVGAVFDEAAAAERFPTKAAALEWLTNELVNLQSAQQTAREYGLHERAWQMCEALWGLLLYRKCYPEWISTHELGVASARACGHRRGEAHLLEQLGLAYLETRRLDEAEELFAEALQLERATDHRLGEASAHDQLGMAVLARGDIDAAIDHFLLARDMHAELGRSRGVALMTRRIGEAHCEAGRYEQAVRDLAEAADRFGEINDAFNQALSRAARAKAHIRAGQPEQAIEHLDRALEAMIAEDATYEQAHIHTLYADALERLGRTEEIRDHLVRALALFTTLQAPQVEQVRRRLEMLGLGADEP